MHEQYDNLGDADISSIDSGVLTAQEACLHDLSPTSIEKLFDELQHAKQDLKCKDNELCRINELRAQTNGELEDLTASLFECAHAMVEQEKYAQANVEEKLKKSNQTIDAFVLENSQLKRIVNELKQILNTCRTSSTMSASKNSNDHILLREFTYWQANPLVEHDSSLFMYRIYNEDILPCLTFPNGDLSSKVLTAIERNDVFMEICHSEDNLKFCPFRDEVCLCDYRIRLGENSPWCSVSNLVRNRIAAVCDFFTFIRHIQLGLVKSDVQSRFNQIIELRKQMAQARLGL